MNKKLSLVLLLAISAICAAAYLAEILIRGWEGLAWIDCRHWTLFLPPVLFVAWMNLSAGFRLGLVRNILFAALYALSFFALYAAYNFLFARGASLFVLMLGIERLGIPYGIFFALLYILILLSYFGTNFGLEKIFGFKISPLERVLVFFFPSLFLSLLIFL